MTSFAHSVLHLFHRYKTPFPLESVQNALLDPFWLNEPIHPVTQETPLIKAVDHSNFELAQLLLQHGAALNHQDQYGQTALMKASLHHDVSLIRLLIQAGADLNIQDRYGHTALIKAAQHGHLQAMRLLLEAGCSKELSDHSGRTALITAATHGFQEAVDLLLTFGVLLDVCNQKGLTALMRAVEKGHTDVVMSLMKHGADIHRTDFEGLTVLHWAARGESPAYIELLQRFIQEGVDIHAINSKGQTAFMLAVQHGSLKAAECLFDAGADVHTQDHQGYSSLHLAMMHTRHHLIPFLFKSGVNPSLQDGQGNNVFHMASIKHHLQVLSTLFTWVPPQDQTLLLQAVNREGLTPLMSFIQSQIKGSSTDCISLLIEAGADVNQVSDSGTALILATQRNLVKTAEVLLNAHADPLVKDFKGKTALNWVQPSQRPLKALLDQKIAFLEAQRLNSVIDQPEKSTFSKPSFRL